jgi:putative transposase
MARMARVVVPNFPHHVTQRGNRRQKTFFCEDDYQYYVELVSEYSQQTGTEVWAYCLMPNHIHLVMVPSTEDGLRATLGEAHRRYTRHINFREGQTSRASTARHADNLPLLSQAQ